MGDKVPRLWVVRTSCASRFRHLFLTHFWSLILISDAHSEKHSTKLEWGIIGLITIEVSVKENLALPSAAPNTNNLQSAHRCSLSMFRSFLSFSTMQSDYYSRKTSISHGNGHL